MNDDLFCKIYVNTTLLRADLITLIAERFNADVRRRSLYFEDIGIDVFENQEADKLKIYNENGFLFYPYYMDIEPEDEVNLDRNGYVDKVRELIALLKSHSCEVVAACDFEEILIG